MALFTTLLSGMPSVSLGGLDEPSFPRFQIIDCLYEAIRRPLLFSGTDNIDIADIPANTQVLAVYAEVVKINSVAASFSLGDTGSATRFQGATSAAALGRVQVATADAGLAGQSYVAANKVRLQVAVANSLIDCIIKVKLAVVCFG